MSEIMKNTSFKVEDIFTDVVNKDTISPEQITKLNNFSAKIKNNVNVNINIKLNFFKPKKNKKLDYQLSAPPEYNFQ